MFLIMTTDKGEPYLDWRTLRRTRQSFVLAAGALVLFLAAYPQPQRTSASGLSLPNQARMANLLLRNHRDENEGVGTKYRTSSVGFYIGDPCKQTCSSVLDHVFCNHTSRRCECRPEYPVNINNRQCVRASSLGNYCAYHEVCIYSVARSSCQNNRCNCVEGHEPDADAKKCTPKRAPSIFDGAELTTMVSVIVALMLFMALFCLVLRLFSKARFGPSRSDRMADAGSPPPTAAVLSSVDGSLSSNVAESGTKKTSESRRISRNSVGIVAPRRPSNNVPALLKAMQIEKTNGIVEYHLYTDVTGNSQDEVDF